MNPRWLLRLEGAAVLAGSVFLYHLNRGGWGHFLLLFPTFRSWLCREQPCGAIAYNAVHSSAAPLLLTVYSFGSHQPALLSLALIWIAHLGFDRMLGFGLKYHQGFRDTHLNPLRHRQIP